MPSKTVNIIAAIGTKTRALGKNNELLWRIPEDLKRFKQLTLNHPIIMGRKTYESIGRPLPQRTNIVITRQKDYQAPGCTVCPSLEEALRKAKESGTDIFIIGGAEIYTQALPFTDKLYLTLVDSDLLGDIFFPEYTNFKKVTSSETKDWEDIHYTWVTLEK